MSAEEARTVSAKRKEGWRESGGARPREATSWFVLVVVVVVVVDKQQLDY